MSEGYHAWGHLQVLLLRLLAYSCKSTHTDACGAEWQGLRTRRTLTERELARHTQVLGPDMRVQCEFCCDVMLLSHAAVMLLDCWNAAVLMWSAYCLRVLSTAVM